MLKKRIIPCLDVMGGRTVKGVHFTDLVDAGDPVMLARRYATEGADELVFLDITATVERRKTLLPMVEAVAEAINIPFTVGGGIGSVDDARAILSAGADKIAVNSAAVRRPTLIRELAAQFGSQAVVLAIDAKPTGAGWRVWLDGGRTPTDLDPVAWAQDAQALGAGEILLTSMAHDGTRQGFALQLTETMCRALGIPVIASGGAGNPAHFVELFSETGASAALAAGIFHYDTLSISRLKSILRSSHIPVR
jgi:cyclase